MSSGILGTLSSWPKRQGVEIWKSKAKKSEIVEQDSGEDVSGLLSPLAALVQPNIQDTPNTDLLLLDPYSALLS